MTRPADILCIGGAVLDRKFRLDGPWLPGTSNPARSSRSFGGVARNISETLARLGVATALVTRVGADEAGAGMIRHLAQSGVDVSRVQTDAGGATAEYLAILAADGSLHGGVSDMAIFDTIDLAELWQGGVPQWVFADCNLPAAGLAGLASTVQRRGAKLAVDCVSMAKAARLPGSLSGIDLLFANKDEADVVLGAVLPPLEAAQALQAKGAAAVILTLGADGLVLASTRQPRHHPTRQSPVVDVTGAGDALVAATLAALVQGVNLPAATLWGMEAAILTIASPDSVRDDLAQALAALATHS